jgi:hypothetical protein
MTIGKASVAWAIIIAAGVNNRLSLPSGPECDNSRYSASPTTTGGRPKSALATTTIASRPGNRQIANAVPSGRPRTAAAPLADRLTDSDSPTIRQNSRLASASESEMKSFTARV